MSLPTYLSCSILVILLDYTIYVARVRIFLPIHDIPIVILNFSFNGMSERIVRDVFEQDSNQSKSCENICSRASLYHVSILFSKCLLHFPLLPISIVIFFTDRANDVNHLNRYRSAKSADSANNSASKTVLWCAFLSKWSRNNWKMQFTWLVRDLLLISLNRLKFVHVYFFFLPFEEFDLLQFNPRKKNERLKNVISIIHNAWTEPCIIWLLLPRKTIALIRTE